MRISIRKIICLILTLAAILYMAVACSDDAKEPEDSGDTYTLPDFSDYESPLSVNGIEIPYEEFRYYFLLIKAQYDAGNEYYWDDHDESEKIRETAVEYIRDMYATLALAKAHDILLTDYQKNMILSEIYSAKESYDDAEDYYKRLDALYLTESHYERILYQNAIHDNLYAYLTSAESGPVIRADDTLINRYIENYVVHAQHILIHNNPGDDMNENETLINSIYQQLLDGADFMEMMAKYSEDTEMNKKDSVGYYFAEGDLGAEFEEAAYALGEGEMSGIVRAPYGYHIILRLPLDWDYIAENFDDQFVDLYQSHMFSLEVKRLMEKQEIVFSDGFKDLTVYTVK